MNDKSRLATIFFAYQRFASLIDYGEYGLSKNQHRVLFCLYAIEEVSIKKLLLILGISKQACNVLIRDLMSRDLVYEEKSEKDRRVKILKLTQAGKDLNTKMNAEQIKIVDAIFDETDNDWQKAMEKMADDYVDVID
ncbi:MULTISPECIES: MarR family winged helix-turn-helix transcriptional regulator [Holzapfeliella]